MCMGLIVVMSVLIVSSESGKHQSQEILEGQIETLAQIISVYLCIDSHALGAKSTIRKQEERSALKPTLRELLVGGLMTLVIYGKVGCL